MLFVVSTVHRRCTSPTRKTEGACTTTTSPARTMLQSQSAEMDLVWTKKYAAKALHQNRVVVRNPIGRTIAA